MKHLAVILVLLSGGFANGLETCNPDYCWLTGCQPSYTCSLKNKGDFCKKTCKGNPPPLIKKKCRNTLTSFLECIKPLIPEQKEEAELSERVEKCYTQSGCSSPFCIHRNVSALLPVAIHTCFGVPGFGIGQLRDIGALAWSTASASNKRDFMGTFCGEQDSEEKPKTEATVDCLNGLPASSSTPTVSGGDLFLCGIKTGVLKCKSQLEGAACKCIKNKERMGRLMKFVGDACGVKLESDVLFGGLTKELCEGSFMTRALKSVIG